jgi:hypothetical protein
MAVPSYTTDLVLIDAAEDNGEWSALGGGGAGILAGADFSMQGTNCIDKQVSSAEKGMVANNGAVITPGTDTHFYIWLYVATPGVTQTLVNRGATIVAGTSTTAYVQFHVEGSDTYGAVGRVGRCYPIRYNNTTNVTAPNYRTLTGAPGANPQYFGAVIFTVSSVKGVNMGVDAIRYGSGIYITDGDATTPGTFSGSAERNDTVANRWGIETFIGGVAYEQQGKLVIGQISGSAHTPTQAYFKDSGKSVLFFNNVHVDVNFNQIIVDHPDTYFELTSCAFIGGGTTSPGTFKFNDHRTTGSLDSCNFTTIGTSSLQLNVSASSCTWSGCKDVVQSGSRIENCNFTKTKLIGNNPTNIYGCNFTYGASGTYGLEVTQPGTYSFAGNVFTGFGPSGSTSASIYNSSGGTVTLNISEQGSIPTYNNLAGSITVISNPVTLTIEIRDQTGTLITSACEVTVVKDSDTSILFAGENVITGTTQYLYEYTGDISAYINVMNVSTYEPKTVLSVTLGNLNQTITIQLDPERGYV